MEEDVQYTPDAKDGKRCMDCQFYELVNDDVGKCFGHDVIAKGGCNKFQTKG